MTQGMGCRGHHRSAGARAGRGPSSYRMQPPQQVFGPLGLGEGGDVIDVGCGAGDYALHAAGLVGSSGRVVACDSRGESVAALKDEASRRGVANLHCLACDVTKRLPLDDAGADVALLFTVLHIPPVRACADALFGECRRVLRKGGRLAVLECRKQDAAFGPPKAMRLSDKEVELLARPSGFVREGCIVFEHTYLLCLTAV